MTAHVVKSVAPGPARRLAALAALGAPVLAVGVSLAVAVRQWVDIAVLAASIVAVMISAWYALTRRGVLRIFAAVVAILAATPRPRPRSRRAYR